MKSIKMFRDLRNAGSILMAASVVGKLLYLRKSMKVDESKCIVVITGCDTGFGFMMANQFAARGFLVVAGCLTPEGLEKLHNTVALTVQCDVTNRGDIEKLVSETDKLCIAKKAKLWAIVNNAGIAPVGFVDWLSDSACRKIMEVNYFGTYFMCKAFLKLLQTKDSRIVNISSAAGFSGLPNGAPYCASKHAVEGMSKCLRQELRPWNIHVCNINPGFMRTPLLDSCQQLGLREYEDPAVKDITCQYPLTNVQYIHDVVKTVQEDPQLVVDAVCANLYFAYPNALHPVGWQARYINWFYAFVPTWLQCRIEDCLNRSYGIGPYPEVLKSIQG